MWVGRGAVLLATWIALASGCGGRSRDLGTDGAGARGASAGTSGGAGSNAGGGGTGREPTHHRPSAPQDCPAERGSNEPSVTGCTDQPLVDCEHDADCTDGIAGRCLSSRFPCVLHCSYDECSNDADCVDDKPCECRQPGSFAPNRCVTPSNCRVDADCGPGGFCSPSLLGELCACISVDYCKAIGDTSMCTPGPCACGDSCGHGYFCHTPADTCLDDSDCVSGRCSFDLAHQNWICTACLPLP